MSQLKVLDNIDVSVLIQRLRTEGMEALTDVYKLYRNEFLGFSQRYFPQAPRETLLYAWHDAMISFYEIALANRYDAQRSSLKTFLFSIGKHKLLKALKKNEQGNFISIEESGIGKDAEKAINELDEPSDKTIQLKQALRKMGDKCRRLLQLMYYHQYSSEAVQEEMNYNSPNVVYSHKSRCLKQLKGIMKEDSKA